MDNIQVGQKLEFNVYGNIVKGKFLSIENSMIEIEVTFDSLGISIPGEIETIHKGFLVV